MITKHTINLTQRNFNIPKSIMEGIESAQEKSPRGFDRYGFHLDIPTIDTKSLAENIITQLIPDTQLSIDYGPHFARGKNGNIFMIIFIRSIRGTELFDDKLHDLDCLGIGRTPTEHLMAFGCFDIYDLDKLTDRQLLNIRGLGAKTLMRIRGYQEKGDRIKHLLERKLDIEKELSSVNAQINLLMEGN